MPLDSESPLGSLDLRAMIVLEVPLHKLEAILALCRGEPLSDLAITTGTCETCAPDDVSPAEQAEEKEQAESPDTPYYDLKLPDAMRRAILHLAPMRQPVPIEGIAEELLAGGFVAKRDSLGRRVLNTVNRKYDTFFREPKTGAIGLVEWADDSVPAPPAAPVPPGPPDLPEPPLPPPLPPSPPSAPPEAMAIPQQVVVLAESFLLESTTPMLPEELQARCKDEGLEAPQLTEWLKALPEQAPQTFCRIRGKHIGLRARDAAYA